MSRKNRDSLPVVLLPDAQFELKEAYGTLRTNLQFLSVSSKLKSILVTSTQPMEGKTTVVINLAIALALADYKVLVIDTDLRKPRIHKYLKIKSNPGLTNCLINDLPFKDNAIKTKYNFDVIPSGPIPPNPSELIGSERMRDLVTQAESEYDYILYDTPPSGLITDSAVLSQFVDGVLFVLRYASTNIDNVRFAKESLEKVGARIIGCVMTDVKKDGYIRNRYSSYGYKEYNREN